MLPMLHTPERQLGASAIADRALAFGRANLRCLAGFAASIADAKEKATTGKPGGDEAASDDRLGTLNKHSGIPQQHPHLMSV